MLIEHPADEDAWMDPCIASMLVISFQAVCGMVLGIVVSALAGVRFLDAVKHMRRAPWSLCLVMIVAGGFLSMLGGVPALAH